LLRCSIMKKSVPVSLLVALSFNVLALNATARDSMPTKGSSNRPVADDSLVKKVPANKKDGLVPVPAVGADENQAVGIAPRPFVAGIDTFGSPRINEVVLKEFLGKDLDTWVEMGLSGNPAALELENNLVKRVKDKWGFAQVDWSIVEYFEGETLPLYITLDVVEPQDVATRMPFKSTPTGEHKDPDGLIKAWAEYQDTAIELIETGQIEPEADQCKAFHCPFGHSHARLKRFEKIFTDGVKKNFQSLVDIQTNDKRGEWRASATYLLAYHKDGKKVVSLMVDRIKDPDVETRNNALRVLGDMAEFHPEFVIPVGSVLEALKFPRVSDRSKALYVVYLSALSSQDARNQILKKWVPEILEILQCKQIDHKELAHGILRKISGKEFAGTDITSWKNWYAKSPGDRTVTRK